MDKDLKPANLIQCGGRVMFKRYEEETKRLLFTVGIFKLRRRMESGRNEYNRDYPLFVMEGDAAEKADKIFEVGDTVSVLGHADTENYMRHVEGPNYRRAWRLNLIADMVKKERQNSGTCMVTLSGEVIRVYRNPDKGRQLYIITVRTGEGSEAPVVSFTHFDNDMSLEPAVGDHVNVSGEIQTKREEDGNGRQRTLVTVVSNFITIDGKKD